ncbi:MAG: methyltransferase, partial [Patescibacteria group bacterium]|nr:methyltransferase [Patescibacteria group bacterium]
HITACDISPDAVKTARENAHRNNVGRAVAVVASDLFSAFSPADQFDWILFNPPYLPTAELDRVKGSLNSALDGGPDGLMMVKKFISRAHAHLSPGGRILMIVSSLQPKERLEETLSKHDLEHEILREESFFFEKLQVWLLKAQG